MSVLFGFYPETDEIPVKIRKKYHGLSHYFVNEVHYA